MTRAGTMNVPALPRTISPANTRGVSRVRPKSGFMPARIRLRSLASRHPLWRRIARRSAWWPGSSAGCDLTAAADSARVDPAHRDARLTHRRRSSWPATVAGHDPVVADLDPVGARVRPDTIGSRRQGEQGATIAGPGASASSRTGGRLWAPRWDAGCGGRRRPHRRPPTVRPRSGS